MKALVLLAVAIALFQGSFFLTLVEPEVEADVAPATAPAQLVHAAPAAAPRAG